MTDDINQKIDELLEGKTSVEESQAILSKLSDADVEQRLKNSDSRQSFETYKQRHPLPDLSLYPVSDRHIDASWRSVVEKAQKPQPYHRVFASKIKEIRQSVFTSKGRLPRYGWVVAALIVFILTPAVYLKNVVHTPDFHGAMRGPTVSHRATFEYSILGPDQKLHRPDRGLHDGDTLFFRVDALADGYCSLYMLHDGRADIIVSDQFLKEGHHDLTTGYELSGNRGDNTIALVFSVLPMAMDTDYIVASINNKVKSMTVNDTSVSIFQRELRVE
ncbi:hypothetical protein JCM14469_41950 [Desulfatiferula olefinivorans]